LPNLAGCTPTRLRRDSYPESSWLYDYSHEPLADPKAEYEYWTAHIWHGYDTLIDNYVFLGMSTSANRHEKLNSAIDGLSYDLAVLQANYVVDRGLRGEAVIRAYRDESAELLNPKVIASWRASCERLSIIFDDQTEDGDLTQAFQRVGDGLRQLLPNLPPASGSPESTEATGAGITSAEPTNTAAGPAINDANNGTDRRKAVDAYIQEVFIRTGKRVTRTDIWKSLHYKSRAEFERWESPRRRPARRQTRQRTGTSPTLLLKSPT
jgi:hypothetical protein